MSTGLAVAIVGEHKPNWVHSGYLEDFIRPDHLKKKIALAKKVLKPLANGYDAIAFRGMSGALLAPSIAMALNKTLIMVRKRNDDCHSWYTVEGDAAARTYIIVDDFMASGSTVGTIVREIEEFNFKAECVGVLEVDRLKPTSKTNKLTPFRAAKKKYGYKSGYNEADKEIRRSKGEKVDE